MAKRGIIFSGPMVLAILEGRKTQTRRLAPMWLKVKKGDLLWVRETHAFQWPGENDSGWTEDEDGTERPLRKDEMDVVYRADNPKDKYPGGWPDDAGDDPACGRWRPSIHMFRRYSRIDLEATADAREESLQDIDEEDARAEGVIEAPAHGQWCDPTQGRAAHWQFRKGFSDLWDSLHPKPGKRWAANPKLVVLSFRKVTP